jgi:diguanylate cyclase (GGDEF)-like protein
MTSAPRIGAVSSDSVEMTARAFFSAAMAGLLGLLFASAPAAASDHDTQRAELARLTLVARAQPERALPAFEALLPQLASQPALEIEALVIVGQVHALLAQQGPMEHVVERLRALGGATGAAQAPHRSWARLAADAVWAQWLRRGGPVGRAERLFSDALAREREADLPPALRLRFVTLHAGLLDQNGRVEPAVQRFQEAITLADAMPAPDWQRAELRSSLAYTLHQAGERARARELIRAALALAQASGDDKTLSSIHTNRAILFSAEAHGPIDAEEREAMRAALDHARLAGAQRDEVLATANLADLYLRHGDYREAIAYSQRALPLARTLHDEVSESVALANIGLATIMLGRKDEGLAWVRQSIAIDERLGNQAELAAMHSELGHYLERAGHAADAYAALREHRRLAAQLSQADQQRRLAELQESFDHEQRQRELALLEREGRLQRSQLVAQQLRQWLWAGGVLFGLLVASLGVLLLMRLRQGNRALADTNARLAQLARRDALTGLANRRHFQAAMKSADAPLRGTLMLIDIDHFKQINDRYGHAAGDAVLVEVARRLRAALREDDLIVRWGGEEFLVHATGGEPAEAPLLVARALESLGGTPVLHGAVPVPVSASIGFASFPLLPSRWIPGWEAALELVDTAMYLAKAHGRNRGYGVRRADAADAGTLAGLARELEAAWHDGRVDLAVVEGPGRLERVAA